MEKEDQNKFWELAAAEIHGENDHYETIELDELLRKSENKSIFKQLRNIHDKLYEARPLIGVSREHSWGKINKYFSTKRTRIFISVAKYAAILLIAFSLGNIFRSVWTLSPESEQMVEARVPLGQMSELILNDGTHVWLNSGTTLRYTSEFGKTNRNVSLDGEAFFKVTHNKFPLRVKLRNSEVEVLGTSFNAISYENKDISYVTLVEGSVTIKSFSGEEIAKIEPSQQITIPENLKNIQVNTVNTDFYHSWTEGKVVFDEERLEDVAVRLERWYNVEIRLEGKGTADLRFSGTILKSKPFDQIVKAFQLLLPISVEYQYNPQKKDVFIISKHNLPMKNK